MLREKLILISIFNNNFNLHLLTIIILTKILHIKLINMNLTILNNQNQITNKYFKNLINNILNKVSLKIGVDRMEKNM